MKSMTGYGYGEAASRRFQVSLEIKSYNNRFLDMYVNTPPHLSPLEPRIREFLAQKILRGKVEVSLRVKDLEEDADIFIDPAFAAGCAAALKRLGEAAGTGEEVRLSHLLHIEGILRTDRKRGFEDYWQEIEPLLGEVFAGFEASRAREGEATERDILRLLEGIQENLSAVSGFSAELEEYFSKTIRARMEELLAGAVGEERVASEAALLLVKYSIHEEIARLGSHCEAFLEAAREGGALGKRLDFICQEMNREINTIGSKNVLAKVSRLVVAMKDALENIREQIRNVE